MARRIGFAKALGVRTRPGVAFGDSMFSFMISALVRVQLFGRENEISCHPPAHWLRLYRRRPLVCPVSLCVRPRLTSEQIRRRLFRNRRDPFLLPRVPRVALVASRFESQESDQDPNRQNSRHRSFVPLSVYARASRRHPRLPDIQQCCPLFSNRPTGHRSLYLPPAPSHHQPPCAPDLCAQKTVTLSSR